MIVSEGYFFFFFFLILFILAKEKGKNTEVTFTATDKYSTETNSEVFGVSFVTNLKRWELRCSHMQMIQR